MVNFNVCDKVKCVANRSIEWQLPSDEVFEVVEVVKCFGHTYLTVSTKKGTVSNVRAHRFEKAEG